MKKFLNKITPSFIQQINYRLLKNNVLGWQLQLPLIFWLWLLISAFAIIVPFLYSLDISGSSDKVGVISVGVIIAVLEFFLFGYILIQFNSTKIFGKKITAHGLKEQFAYLIVMFLCLTYIVVAPLILDFRKGAYMTEAQIKKEAVIFNKARHYFMDSYSDFKYFPDSATFKQYKEITFNDSSRYRNKEQYYLEQIKPRMAGFFTDTSTDNIDPQYTRSQNAPDLYYTGYEYIRENYDYDKEEYSSFYYFPPEIQKEPYEYQLIPKTREERLKDITEFINLYNKYQELNQSSYYNKIVFDRPEEILAKYEANQFDINVHDYHSYNSYNETYRILDNDVIDDVHWNVVRSKYGKWDDMGVRAMIAFHVALLFALLFFVFKNVRLKEFILTFVYSGLLTLVVAIVSILSRAEEFIPLHTLIVLFFSGLFFACISGGWHAFSHKKTILVILSNLFFSYVPIFFFFYFYEYLNWWNLDYEYCQIYEKECAEHRRIVDIVRWVCLWGGPVIYLLIGSLFYKKVYEKIFALPLRK